MGDSLEKTIVRAAFGWLKAELLSQAELVLPDHSILRVVRALDPVAQTEAFFRWLHEVDVTARDFGSKGGTHGQN